VFEFPRGKTTNATIKGVLGEKTKRKTVPGRKNTKREKHGSRKTNMETTEYSFKYVAWAKIKETRNPGEKQYQTHGSPGEKNWKTTGAGGGTTKNTKTGGKSNGTNKNRETKDNLFFVQLKLCC
jgi:hypothetical protein